MRWTRMAGFVGLMLLALCSAGAQQAGGPPVVHAEVPYCARALLMRVSGQVLIRVTIDQQGKVTSATVEHEQPATTECSEAAAKNWIFAPSDQGGAREALLSFLFTGKLEETDEPSHVVSSFDDPWTLRIGYARNTVRRLPRENGRIPEERCPVHGEVMAVEVVRVWYGLPQMYTVGEESPEELRKHAAETAYLEAKEMFFPKTNRHDGGGCFVREPKAEVYYCQSCREAEREWLESHPGWNPNEE
jgi:TonB family protein